MPRWFRTAMVLILMAGAAISVPAESTHARPRQCNTFVKWVQHDQDMVKYWAEAANAAFQAAAWDEYQYDVMKYNFYVSTLTTDSYYAKQSGCV
jgi:hypothetical protein